MSSLSNTEKEYLKSVNKIAAEAANHIENENWRKANKTIELLGNMTDLPDRHEHEVEMR